MMEWRKASGCGPNGPCVEVAERGHVIAVRDSKDPTARELRFYHDEWVTFIEGVKAGEFDPGFTGNGRQDFSQ